MKTNAENAANANTVTETLGTLLPPLEENLYLVSDADLAKFAVVSVAVADTLQTFRQAYMRVLLAGTQVAIGIAKPTQRTPKNYSTLKDDVRATQIRALNDTHARYYSIILAAITTPDIVDSLRLGADERKRRSIERNRRSNYARSAKSTLAAYLNVGYDLCELNVLKASKTMVRGLVAQRKTPSEEEMVGALPERIEAAVKRITAYASTLSADDAAKATEVIQDAMSQLGNILLDMGMKPTKKLDVGVRENRPVQMNEGMFWPILGSSVGPPEVTAH